MSPKPVPRSGFALAKAVETLEWAADVLGRQPARASDVTRVARSTVREIDELVQAQREELWEQLLELAERSPTDENRAWLALTYLGVRRSLETEVAQLGPAVSL